MYVSCHAGRLLVVVLISFEVPANEPNGPLADVSTGSGNRMIGALDDKELCIAPGSLQMFMQFAGMPHGNDNVIVTVYQQNGRVILRNETNRRHIRFCSARHFQGRCAGLITQQLSVGRMFVFDLG